MDIYDDSQVLRCVQEGKGLAHLLLKCCVGGAVRALMLGWTIALTGLSVLSSLSAQASGEGGPVRQSATGLCVTGPSGCGKTAAVAACAAVSASVCACMHACMGMWGGRLKREGMGVQGAPLGVARQRPSQRVQQ